MDWYQVAAICATIFVSVIVAGFMIALEMRSIDESLVRIAIVLDKPQGSKFPDDDELA